MYRARGFVGQLSLLLIFGALAALIWTGADPYVYHAFGEFNILGLAHAGGLDVNGQRTALLPPGFGPLIYTALMFILALALTCCGAEALLCGQRLKAARRAATA